MSGRRNHSAAAATAERLTALAGRLTDRDWQVCRLLADHQVLTTSLLALLLDASPRTLQQRLTRLAEFQVVERFRPYQPLGAGSAPYHYLLAEAGAAVLAADPHTTADPPDWDATQLLRLAHANGRLTHLLAVNTLLAQLTQAARHQPDMRLVCWWPARRCQAQWGPLIGPDAYARWQDPDGEVDFFLHHSPALPTALLEGYHELAAATAITTPVLLHAGDPDHEAQQRDQLAGRRLLVPVATTNPTCGPPTDPVWLPTSSPAGGRRYRLGALGHPDPWHPPPSLPPPHRGRQPPGGARPVEGPARWR